MNASIAASSRVWDWVFGWEKRREAAATLRRAADFIEPGDVVLDIGSGNGYVIDVAADDYGAFAVGCDVVLPRRPIKHLVQFDGWNLPFADKSVDLALLVFVLHHAKNPNQLLQEAARVSRKAILVVEDSPSNAFDLKWARSHIRRFNRRHGIPWVGEPRTEAEWRRLFSTNELRVLNTSRLSRLERVPPVARAAFLLVPKRFAVQARRSEVA